MKIEYGGGGVRWSPEMREIAIPSGGAMLYYRIKGALTMAPPDFTTDAEESQ